MCQAQSYVDQFHNLFSDIKETHTHLSKMLSEADRELSQVYHKIESAGHFDVVRGYYFAKEVQGVLLKRRVIKDELSRVRSVYHPLSESIKQVNGSFKRALRASEKVRGSLNVTVSFDEMFK